MIDPIRILLVDDHPIVRQGIRSLLSNYPELNLVAEADNVQSGLKQFLEQQPDITLLDIRMPGQSGLALLQQIRQQQPNAKVLMLTSFDEEEYVLEALRAGAQGYVLKGASYGVLAQAIEAVWRGERVLSPEVTEQMVQKLIAQPPKTAVSSLPEIDKTEVEILKLLVTGANNSEIAAQLFVSNTTVKRKLRKLFALLSVQSRAQAAAEAVRRGLV